MKQVSGKAIAVAVSVFFLSFAFSPGVNAQNETKQEMVYVKIEINGMACPYCAFGMEKELKEVAGVEKVDIELKEGLAFISTPINQKPSKESLKKIIIDGGFSIGRIEFSNVPFNGAVRTKTE